VFNLLCHFSTQTTIDVKGLIFRGAKPGALKAEEDVLSPHRVEVQVSQKLLWGEDLRVPRTGVLPS
jgi:hypothetical protein